MARHAASTRGQRARWPGVPLVVGVAILTTACSGGGSSASGNQATPGTVAGTTVNLRSNAELKPSVVVAVGLWNELRTAGVSSTITGYDQKGRFSLSTSDPARLRQVVADLQVRSAGTTTTGGNCATGSAVTVEESPTPPDPQPGPAQDRQVAAFQTTAPIVAGTTGESAFGGDTIREISIRADDRPPTYVVTPTQAAMKKAAADFGPGLIVVDGMFVDPALARLTTVPRTC